MPTFEELMEQFRNPGDAGVPADFADQLQTTYQEEMSVRDAAVQEREAKIAEFDKEREAHNAEIRKLKAVNYDLMVSAPKPGEKTPGEQNDNGESGAAGIDSLFE
ncbi:hypothetical protein SEA_TILLUMS_12 [Arthrobacter phage Tillums]|nr:hypothetical protein SEA_TILLUMS_12 [Arthrobacter phage Tillums]